MASWAVTGMPSTTRSWLHGQLLVDDPERIGPIQATGMTRRCPTGEYRTSSERRGPRPTPLKSAGYAGLENLSYPVR